MNVFTMVLAIVAISLAADCINKWIKTRRKGADSEMVQRVEALEHRIETMQERLENIESLVLKQEKYRSFDKELSGSSR